MGCISSKEEKNNGQGSSPNIRSGRTQDVRHLAGKQGAKLGNDVCDDFTDVVSPELKENEIGDKNAFQFSLQALPPYSESDPYISKSNSKTNKSAKIILDTVREAHQMQKHGINGAFNVLAERHIHIWIDASYLHSRDTKIAIELQAAIHLQLGQAKDSDMTFFFTSYPNLDSENLGKSERKLLLQLIRVWETSSWSNAEEIVSRNEILSSHFELASWMKGDFKPKRKEGEMAQVEQVEQAGERHDGASERSPNEKHTILLAHVRELMLPFWHGWHQRDFAGVDDLFLLCKEARKAAKRQRKCLNSICIMYRREIGLYLRLREQKQAFPVTCFPLIGSMMQSGEVSAIKSYQQVNDHKLKKRLTYNSQPKKGIWKRGGAASSNAETVEGEIDAAARRDLPFQITGMVDIEEMSVDGVKGFQDIDSAFKGEDDINDIKTYMHTMYLNSFFSPCALFLYYNGHNKEVDDVEISQEDMYGAVSLTTATEKKILIPHVKEFMEILGMDAEDWEQPKSKIRIARPNPDAEKVTIQQIAAN
jgi:hypothetical protein